MKCLQEHINLFYLLKYRNYWHRSELEPNGLLATKIRQVKEQIRASFAEQSVNWRTPKFEALDAWPKLISMLGPPCFQTTDTWEATHLPNKHDSENTNHHNAERDVLLKVSFFITVQTVLTSIQRTAQVLFKYHQAFRTDAESIKYKAAVLSITPCTHLFSDVTFGHRKQKNYPKQRLKHMTELLQVMDGEVSESFEVSGT